jgi:hypothetical protein
MAMLQRRIRLGWQTCRFFARTLLEYVATGWLLGIAPSLAHLAATAGRTDYRWVQGDLYLFVMTVGGNLAIRAFKDRSSDGPGRPLAGMLGSIMFSAAAWSYGSLETDVPAVREFVRSHVEAALATTLGIDLCFRVPAMIRRALKEARGKERLSSD